MGTNEKLPELDNGVMVRVNGVDLYLEHFGDADDPAILLIHGASASMYGWQVEFCQRLVDGGRFVVRFDQRDTGQSVSYPPGAPGYTMGDLVWDVLGMLDVLEIERAHLVGGSMGGGIAIGASMRAPERVASLTLMATTPGGPGLPPMTDRFVAKSRSREQPDWSDREAVIDYQMGFFENCAGPRDHFDMDWWHEMLGRDVDRTVNVASSLTNHFVLDIGDAISKGLDEVDVPTLVIHGDQDPIFPLGHGEALAERIPNARLLVLEETGHLMLEPTWDRVVPAILEHTEG